MENRQTRIDRMRKIAKDTKLTDEAKLAKLKLEIDRFR